MRFGEALVYTLIAFVFIALGWQWYIEMQARDICHEMGYDHGTVSYNQGKHYICRNSTIYWVDGEQLVKEKDNE